MSHTALRRVAIRLVHDPGLVDALRSDPVRALAGLELSPEEIAWLLAVPAAAWRTDPERPRRVLAALADEFPTSSRLAPARASRFFASRHFHAAVQERGSLALAFGALMAEDSDPRVVALAALETATAAVRRAPVRPAPSPAGHRRLTPHARVVRVRQDAPALLAALRAGGTAPALGSADEDVLVLRAAPTSEVTIESLSPELAAVLRRAESAMPVDALVGVACSLGADPAEARELVESLAADAVLV